MKKATFTLTIFFSLMITAASGQVKDLRAELDIQGRVNEISVAPDEKIWLVTALGQQYYTNSIDSNWHYAEPLFNSDDESIQHSPILQRISFFNKDTAIMTGYISAGEKRIVTNGLYRTINGGQTWELLEFCGDSWIYDVFVDSLGNAWMGGSSGEIYFSSDFGYHWEKLNSPYNSSSRMNSIFMINSTTGISGALHNFIYTTTDNWKSCAKIETPFDQGKYKKANSYSDDRIIKILPWNNFIVVNQNGHIFWTEKEDIEWKPFSINIDNFILDPESKTLIVVTDNLQILSFSSPSEFQWLTSERLPDYPLDMKIVNHSLFIVTNSLGVYKVNQSGLTFCRPYTADKNISEPPIIKNGTNLTWGANGNHLYLLENSDNVWFREKMLDFSVSDLHLLSDSVAILWDGISRNYLYSLKDHETKRYFHERPLENFLASPVKKFVVLSGSQGCFRQRENVVQYKKENDSTFATSAWMMIDCSEKDSLKFKNRVSVFSLSNVLAEINEHPHAMPSLQDFQITDTDVKNYLSLVDKRMNQMSSKRSNENSNEKKEFYYSVPSRLDTLNKGIVPAILNMQDESWSTTRNWFVVQLVNQNNDTLSISRSYYVWTLPWNMPWHVNYRGQHFACFSIGFSRFINECIPEEFIDKEVFDNSTLIMVIADMLWKMKE